MDKRNEHWKKLEELDQQALAPDRYKNRGGQLLLEEKQRNFLRKGIPKIEQKLVELSEKYERETGKVFTSWGKTIGSLIEDTADNYIYVSLFVKTFIFLNNFVKKHSQQSFGFSVHKYGPVLFNYELNSYL